MRVAITGGTGFVGRHLARRLGGDGHEVVLVARGFDASDPSIRSQPWASWRQASTTDRATLVRAFEGCDAVAHCAGINRELGDQTYARVHVEGTRAVVGAARQAGVRRLVFLSFLRARPDSHSPYHESKWAAEEVVRDSGLAFTIVKPGIVYGPGDHLVAHVSLSIATVPIFPVPRRRCLVAPLQVDDLGAILAAAVTTDRLGARTLGVVGPDVLALGDAVRRIASANGRRVLIVPAPMAVHRAAAAGFEVLMHVPLMSRAQARILSEGVVEPTMARDRIPDDLIPRTRFTEDALRRSLPAAGRFGPGDLRCAALQRR